MLGEEEGGVRRGVVEEDGLRGGWFARKMEGKGRRTEGKKGVWQGGFCI